MANDGSLDADGASLADDRQSLLNRTVADLAKIEKAARSHARSDRCLTIVGIVFGIIATVVAALAGASGTPIAESVGRLLPDASKPESKTEAKQESVAQPTAAPRGWRIICLVVALLAGLSTIAYQLHNGLKVADRRQRSAACAGQLRAICSGLESRVCITKNALDTARKGYNDLTSNPAYAEFFIW